MSIDEKFILLNLFEKYNSALINSGHSVTIDDVIASSKAAAIIECMEKLGVVPDGSPKYESRCSQK